MARAMAVVALLGIVSGCMAAEVEVTLPLKHADAVDMPGWVANVARVIEGGTVRLGTTRLVPRPELNALLVSGEEESVEWVKAIVAALDKPSRQVAFEIVFVRTRHADKLLGVPVTTTLDVGGQAVEVPTRFILPGVAGLRRRAGWPHGGPATPDATPEDMLAPPSVAICNTAYEPQALDALRAEGKARTLAEPRVTVLDNSSGFVGVETLVPAQYEVNEFGQAVGRSIPRKQSLAIGPTVRSDGRVLVQASFTVVSAHGGEPSLSAAWVAEPGVPVAVGAVPVAPGVDSMVFIVTCRVAEP